MASDSDLIARSLAGDGEAFVEMIGRHEVAIGRYLARRVGPETAEDLLGEVWVAAFTSRASYDPAYADARPWLYTVALNLVRRHWRSLPPEDLMPDLTDVTGQWNPWPAVETRMDTRTALNAALTSLKPEEREVLTLVAGEDLSAADAARVLGIPAGSARRLLHQARTALRNAPSVAALLKELNSVKEEGK